MSRIRKVFFFSSVHGHRWPGSEYLWAETAERLLHEKVSVVARVSEDFEGAEKLKSLIESGLVCETYASTDPRWKRLVTRFIPRIKHLVRHFDADALVISSGSAFDPHYLPELLRFCRDSEVPYLFICHFNAEGFWVDEKMRISMRELLRKAAKVIFVSDENRRLTERQLALRLDKASVLQPPLNLRLENPLPVREHSSGSVEFATVARLDTRWKGQDVLLEVLSSERWRKRAWNLNFYGSGGEEEYLRELVELYDLQDRVRFHGHVADRLEIWRSNDIQLLAARGEGGPMVLTEGMMCGRPAVVTRCGIVDDLVEDGRNGFIANAATAPSFSSALERAWEARSEWPAAGQKAHARVKAMAHHDPAAELLQLLRESVVEKEVDEK